MNHIYKKFGYQERKVESMIERIKIHREVALQAPTGSGKTVIMAYFLDRFIDANQEEYAYIWASPRSELPKQSMKKISAFFENTEKITSCHRDEIENRIRPNQVWFVNWEYLITLIDKEGEDVFSLQTIIDNTKKDSKIMLVVDESHWGAESRSATKTKSAIDIISPDKKIHITATPRGTPIDDEPVAIDQVRVEGMVVEKIHQNPNMKNEDANIDDKLIEEGIKKRNELAEKYKSAKISVNPLLLIQIPNDTKDADNENLIERIKLILNKHAITDKNIQIWTATKHIDENIDLCDNTNEVAALIFKQAISLGWDCPRAQILVGLRKMAANTFGIQTLGRIMRTPEQKHYNNKDLNVSFLYSASSILEDGQTITGILDTKPFKIKENVNTSLNLPRYRVKNLVIDELSDLFKNKFLELALEKTHLENNMAQAMNHNVSYRTTTIPVDREIDELKHIEHNKKDRTATYRVNEKENDKMLGKIIEDVAMENNLGLTNYRSELAGFLIEILHEVFTKSGYDTDCQCFVEMCGHYNDHKILNMVLNDDNNTTHLKRVLKNTLEYFSKQLQNMKHQEEENQWNIEEKQVVNVSEVLTPNQKIHRGAAKDYSKKFNNYVMTPAYIKMDSLMEIKFSEYLDNLDSIEWWFKNDTTNKSFGIPYIVDEYKYSTFMPDFIVKMNDGRIGIFDTKDGDTLELAGSRANALADYIKQVNSTHNLNLFGGIVTEKGSGWKLHDKNPFNPRLSDEGWKILNLSDAT